MDIIYKNKKYKVFICKKCDLFVLKTNKTDDCLKCKKPTRIEKLENNFYKYAEVCEKCGNKVYLNMTPSMNLEPFSFSKIAFQMQFSVETSIIPSEICASCN